MARYRVRGASRDTGAEFEIFLDAASATVAEREAQTLGMLVSDVAADLPTTLGAVKQPPKTPTPAAGPRGIICPNPNCGYAGTGVKQSRGSLAVFIILLFVFFPAAIIYFAVFYGSTIVCPVCGGTARVA